MKNLTKEEMLEVSGGGKITTGLRLTYTAGKALYNRLSHTYKDEANRELHRSEAERDKLAYHGN